MRSRPPDPRTKTNDGPAPGNAAKKAAIKTATSSSATKETRKTATAAEASEGTSKSTEPTKTASRPTPATKPTYAAAARVTGSSRPHNPPQRGETFIAKFYKMENTKPLPNKEDLIAKLCQHHVQVFGAREQPNYFLIKYINKEARDTMESKKFKSELQEMNLTT